MTRRLAPLFLPLVSIGAAQPPTAQTTMLDGQWISGCIAMGENGHHGTIVHLAIADRQIEAVAQTYAHSTCDIPTLRTRFLASLVGVTRRRERIDVQLAVRAITLAPQQAKVVQIYNEDREAKGCGATPWRLDTPQSIAGKTCAGLHFPARGVRLSWRAWREGDALRVPSPLTASPAGGTEDTIVLKIAPKIPAQ